MGIFIINLFLGQSQFNFASLYVCTYQWHVEANADWPKNMLLSKNPQFLPNHYETWLKWATDEYLILAKFHNDWIKIVNFFIKRILLVSVRIRLCMSVLGYNYECMVKFNIRGGFLFWLKKLIGFWSHYYYYQKKIHNYLD